MDYMKIILGTRYKKHEITKAHKQFSNMLTNNIETINNFYNPDFKQNMKLLLNQNIKYKYHTMITPTKVDLLVYNKTIENNSGANVKIISHEQQMKKRLYSRNFRSRTKTICFTRTLTNSGRHNYK